jgi:hypothetical protein
VNENTDSGISDDASAPSGPRTVTLDLDAWLAECDRHADDAATITALTTRVENLLGEQVAGIGYMNRAIAAESALTASRGEVAMLTADRESMAAEVGRLRAEVEGLATPSRLTEIVAIVDEREGWSNVYPKEARQIGMALSEHIHAVLDSTPVPTLERVMDHDFLPVAGHPDDDECTHRSDGTDLTYCGEPEAAHAPTPDLRERMGALQRWTFDDPDTAPDVEFVSLDAVLAVLAEGEATQPAYRIGDHCPTCDSPSPERHPAMQFEGEVQALDERAREGGEMSEPMRVLINALEAIETDLRGRDEPDEVGQYDIAEMLRPIIATARASLAGKAVAMSTYDPVVQVRHILSSGYGDARDAYDDLRSAVGLPLLPRNEDDDLADTSALGAMGDDVKARAVEALAQAAHRHACKLARQNGGEEGIEWVKWKRLPEFAQEAYRAEARDLVKALRAAGLLADPDAIGRAKAEARLVTKMAAALLLMCHDAHPSYANTTGWRGGIGGQSITQGCNIIDPPPGDEWAQWDMPSMPLREWLAQHPEVDVRAEADALKAELLREIHGNRADRIDPDAKPTPSDAKAGRTEADHG